MPQDATGYTADKLEDILTDMSSAAVSGLGPDIDTSENSLLGIILGLVAIQAEQQGQHVQELYGNQDPDTAEGKALDDLCYKTGIIRKDATKSTVTLQFTNTSLDLESIPSGTEVTTAGGSKFLTLTDINVPISGSETVEAEAEVAGAIVAKAESLTQYSPSITDVTVTNLSDASVGTEVETDTNLRLRRSIYLAAGGNSTVNAIATQISNLSGVTSLIVVENDTSEYISRGQGNTERPPHSFEVVVEGGLESEITQIISTTKPIGIESFGDTTIPTQDIQGMDRKVGLTRPRNLDLYVKIIYTIYDEETFPSNGELLIKESLVEFASEHYTLGKDVIPQRLEAHVHKSVAGIKTVLVQTSFNDVEFDTNIKTLEVFERAILETSNISFIE